jgi:hypothetical protein
MHEAAGVRLRGQKADSALTSLPYQDTVDVRNSGQKAAFVLTSLHPDAVRTPRIDDPPPDGALPDEYWDAILSDPRAAKRPGVPISQRRLSEIPRELLRVECSRCFRTVEIQRLDAIRLYGPHSTWRDVGQHLLDGRCEHRTGNHEEDGCWPDFSGK